MHEVSRLRLQRVRLRSGRLTLALIATMVTPRFAAAQAVVDLPAFLSGCWELQRGNRVTHEQWMSPLGGMMLGGSRTVVSDTAREWEALSISVRDGGLLYAAQPGGRPPTLFEATSMSDTSVHFSNPQHDFPQRISYVRRGTDSLIARIEGGEGEQSRGIDFPMRRIACGG